MKPTCCAELLQQNNHITIDMNTDEIKNITSSWQSLFKCTILTLINFEDLNYTNNTDNSCLCIEKGGVNITKLLIQTHTNLNANILNYSYHHMLSLRRQIMIITNIFTDYQCKMFQYHQTQLIQSIMDLFVFNYNKYQQLSHQDGYKWYHLHIHKSAGRTMQHTISKIFKYPACKEGTSANLNCTYQYQRQNDCFYIEREAPMMTHSNDNLHVLNDKDNIYNKPSICHRFIYLLPFREPIERICSQSAHLNQRPAFFEMDNILRTSSSYNDIHKNDNIHNNDGMITSLIKNVCYKKDIVINGVKYRLLTEGIDYRNFFKTLINSEINNEKYVKLFLNQTIKNYKYLQIRNNETSTASRYKLWQFDVPFCFRNKNNVHLFPIEYVDNLNESEFIYVVTKGWRMKNGHNIENLRSISGSNVYTSWLGFEDKYYKQFSWIPNFIPRSKINFNHFINAMWFILKIDYVLPFSTKKGLNENINDKSIWNITLNDIYNYYLNVIKNKKNSNQEIWRMNNDFIYFYPTKYEIKNERQKLKWINRWISMSDPYRRVMPTQICNSLLKDEKDLLYKWNKFDIKLYQIAKLIEKVDIDFRIKYHS